MDWLFHALIWLIDWRLARIAKSQRRLSGRAGLLWRRRDAYRLHLATTAFERKKETWTNSSHD